jgi:urea transport system permease protein
MDWRWNEVRMIQRDSALAYIRRWGVLLALAVLLLLVAPLALSDFRLNLLGKFLTYAIVAVGLDLLWGYGGMLSLGQGLFFALGAYGMGMYLKLEASGKQLPDFMVWSGLDRLPLFWQPFRHPAFALGAALLVPMALAGLIGFLVFRSRIQGVYFSIITQALTLIVGLLFIGQQPLTGGTNGITNLSTIFGYALADRATQRALYFATALCLLGVYLLCRWLVGSRFGRLLVATRDDEHRLRFLGYNPVMVKTLVFMLGAGLAALAGALFIPQVGIISPSAMGVVPSVEMLIWVAVGGRGTLLGPIAGALLTNWAKSGLSENLPTIWQYFQGALFVGVVLLFPQGLGGIVRQLSSIARARLSANAQPAGQIPAEISEERA